jgi:uncharacterized protein YndB with AHSA1/START domain
MTVTAVHKDPKALTMTVEAEFETSPERLWQLWADPRQLERWWGPPAYPATVTAHDLARGGGVDYHMTGPAGDQPHGHWEILAVEPPHHLMFRDDGCANDDDPQKIYLPAYLTRVRIEAVSPGRTRMSIESAFPSLSAMEHVLGRGTLEGQTEAVGQIDALLAADPVLT